MRSILFISLFAVCNTIFGQQNFQPGYIITNNNEKVNGWIDKRESLFNQKHCNFKTDSLSKTFSEYLPTQIKAYRFNDSKYYASQIISTINGTDTVFLECLLSGKVSLWYYSTLQYESYYVEQDGNLTELDNRDLGYVYNSNYKDGQKFQRLSDKDGQTAQYTRNSEKYKGILKYTFRDCPEIYSRLTRLKYNKKSLIDISKDYHQRVCKTEDCIIYEKTIPKTKWYFGAFVMPRIQTIQLKYDVFNQLDITLQPTKTIDFGAFIQVNNKDISERLFFQLAGYYSKLNAEKDIVISNITNKYNLSTSILTIEPGAIYKFSYPKVKPYISAGMPFGKILDNNLKLTKSSNYSHPMESQLDNKIIIGANIGIGVEYMLNSKLSLFSSINYGYSFTAMQRQQYSISGINLLAGIRF